MERMPTYHKWYAETIDKRTFGFLIEEGYVYFIIFLKHVRDEFRKVSSRRSFSSLISSNIHEQLVLVFHSLITSLEHVSQHDWNAKTSLFDNVGLSPSQSDANKGKIDSTSLDSNNQGGVASSISLQKKFSTRIRSSSQRIRKKW
ncbi:hypothetical protein P3X46_013644 [Hevea brasiliensis]|uniref:Uncharacterized protein n=1 Tax=Hevea brasiliensis TaxID=3981 RepID=A0ABQ9M7T8_HEVBR|nr:hypothetical protein P3X46_013644 [Hevea brasiliensis]